ncbi:MAG: tetratricopeptide repeat protein [Lysobacteraceae bacterium]
MTRRRAQRLWRDLRRRRMFGAVGFYVVAAWAFVQAASIAFPAFGMPDWTLRAVLVAAFAGFPVAVVLAWVFDFSARGGLRITAPEEGKYPQGRRPPRWWLRPLLAAPLLALIVGGTVWLWTARLAHTGESEFTRQARPDELPVVAVLPLDNLTGHRDLDWTGPGIAALVRDELAQSHAIVVVSPGRTARLAAGAKDPQALLADAADAGITHVLTGEVLRTPRGLTVTSRLTDLRRNVELGANRQEGLSTDQALSYASTIASVVRQGLGLPGTERIDVFAADFAARNPSAYEAFIAGMENFLRFDYADARNGFAAAVQRAPDFAIARYRLAHTLAALGDTDGALKQIEAARRDAARLPERDRAYIAAGEAYFRRDYPEAERRYRALLAQYPYESEARALLLYVLIDEDRTADALAEAETLVQQDPGDEVGWSAVADQSLRLGHYPRADEAIARLLRIAPDNPNASFLAGESAFLRGRLDEAATRYREALRHDPAFGDAQLRLARIDVLRGQPQAAVAGLQSMVAGDFAPSQRISAAFDLAGILRASGRCADALRALDQAHAVIAAEQVRVSLELATRARCALDAGDAASARALAQQAVARSPGPPVRYLYVRGLAELAAGDGAALQATLAQLRAQADTADNRKAHKAADVLEGEWRLRQGDVAGALRLLRQAHAAPGYEYDAYALPLARALRAGGDLAGARRTALEASRPEPPGDLRLDLEADRRRARELLRSLG